MSGVQSLPVWAVILAAVGAAGLFTGFTMSLMVSRKQRLSVLWGVAAAAAFIGVMAVVKHNAVNHALVLFADVMVALTVALLPVSRALKSVSLRSVETGVQQSLTNKQGLIVAIVMIVTFVVLLTVEYIVL